MTPTVAAQKEFDVELLAVDADTASAARVSLPTQRTSSRANPSPIIESITVLGVNVAALDTERALAEIDQLLSRPEPQRISYVNAACLNIAAVNPGYRAILHSSQLVLNDGIGLDIAARFQGRQFPENMNGTDFTPKILANAAATGKRVYLLGGQDGIACAAKANLELRYAGLNIVGFSHGYHDSGQETSEVVREIRSLKVDILIVGMGVPTQEIWLERNLSATGAQLGIAVGAFIDFAAGRMPRAPYWVRRLHLEWAFRLGKEPCRLFRRYVVGNPIFLLRVVLDKSYCVGGSAERKDRNRDRV